MKTLFKYFLTAVFFVLAFASCEDDDNVNFTLQEASEDISFTNDFSANYLLSEETKSNTAERLVWNPVDFGQPTVITYTLEGSIDNTSFEEISSTTETNISISVSRLLDFAEELGLDNDPNTDDGSGNSNDSGIVYFRVSAIPGDGTAANAPATVSESVALNISIVEVQVSTGPGLAAIQVSDFGLVGAAINNWGETPDTPMYTRGDGVHFVSINNPGAGTEFKIRESNDWGLPSYGPGETEVSISESGLTNLVFPEGDILTISVDVANLTILITTDDSWGVVGDVINNFGGDGPDIRLTQDPAQPGLWFALSIALEAGQTKFRLNNDWANNWGPDGSGGLSQGSFDNFQVDAGTYDIYLDLRTTGAEVGGFGTPGSFEDLSAVAGGGSEPRANPISLSTFGLVGSLINEWGGNGADLALYTQEEGIYFASLNLPGGVGKIRENNDWAVNYGNGETEGSLVQDGFENDIEYPEGSPFLVTINLNDLTYSIKDTDSWGIVGDAINNFGAEEEPFDIRLTQDPANPGVWVALGVSIPAGQAKFRLNNDWTNNWGPDGSGGLSQGSFDNFQLEEGVYNVTLDLSTEGSETASFEPQ